MQNPFTKHPYRLGETYLEHLKFASLFAFQMLIGGIAGLIHAVFPFLFEKTASNVLLKLTQNFIDRVPLEKRIINLSTCINKKLESDTRLNKTK